MEEFVALLEVSHVSLIPAATHSSTMQRRSGALSPLIRDVAVCERSWHGVETTANSTPRPCA
jgi:hypothetical protein